MTKALKSYNIEVVAAKNGIPTLKIDSVFVHSYYNPLKEAQRLGENHYKSHSYHILIGLGLGYLAEDLFSRFAEDDYLLIIEPNEEIYKLAAAQNKIEQLISSDRVFFCIGKGLPGLKNHFNLLMQKGYLNKANVIESPNYNRLFPELLGEIKSILKETSMQKLININTVHLFANVWQQNLFANLYQARQAISFTYLRNKLSCPAIIVSAGPSLTKQLPMLKTIQDKALILCAGSAINSLLREGITPHAIITIDGGEGNYRHFQGQDFSTIPIVYSLTVHREIPRHHKGTQVLFNDNPKFSKWLSEYLGHDIGLVRGGHTVANYTLDIACQITSGSVCFIGQDLAYTNNQSHAAGNKNQKTVNLEEIENDKRYTYTRGYYGDTVLTDHVFLGMKKTFEAFITYYRQQKDNRPIINATEGGAYIDGAEHLAFKDFVMSYCTRDVSKDLQSLFTQEKIHMDWQRALALVNEEKIKMESIIKLCEKASSLLEDSSSKRIKGKTLNRLEKIDAKLKPLFEFELMHYILQPVIFRVEHRYPAKDNETPEEIEKRVLLISKSLYKDILETTIYSKEIVEQLIDNIKNHTEE